MSQLEEAVEIIKECRIRLNYGHLTSCPYPTKLMATCLCRAEEFKIKVENFLGKVSGPKADLHFNRRDS